MSKFSSNIDYLRQYVNGELSAAEMYAIERAMHEDEMLMDIIEGLQTEKDLKLQVPIFNFQTKTVTSVIEKPKTKLFNFRKWSIAASLLAIVSFGAYFIWNQNSETDNISELAVNENKITPLDLPSVDSTVIANTPIDELADDNMVTESQIAANSRTSTAKNTSILATSPKKLMVYTAKPKLQVVIDGPKFHNKQEEEIIVNYGNSFLPQVKNDLLTAKIGTPNQSVTIAPNISKTQADLQKLDIDPQTKATLTAMLSRQAMDRNAETKEKQTESNSISEVLTIGNVMANKNNSDSKIISSTESMGILGAKPIQNGNPTIGWTKFNAYVKEQLNKKGFDSYTANISFELDSSQKPTNVIIKSSSNAKINTSIIEILMLGPSWENKDPNHPIFIRINSEETTKK